MAFVYGPTYTDAAGNIWRAWTTTTCTSGTATIDVWPYWASTSSTTTITTNDVWPLWVQITGGGGAAPVLRGPQPVPTPEQRAAIQRAAEEQCRIHAERVAAAEHARRVADNRALDLLMSMLNAEQQEEFRKHKRFTVRRERARYVVEHGVTHNIHRVDERGRVTHNVCGYAANVPVYDNLLAQKLALETDDAEFLKRSNVFERGHRVGQILLPELTH